MLKIKGKAWNGWLYCFIGILILLLIYSRFVNLFWGLPLPFHPDERNMAVAIETLRCDISGLRITDYGFWKECFNPHFFAYGQFPLYLSWILLQFAHFAVPIFNPGINFIQAIVVLRIIAATASLLTVFFAIRIVHVILNSLVLSLPNGFQDPMGFRNKFGMTITTLILLTFSPALIQFAHFGTTESLLMFFYTAITYYSLKLLDKGVTRYTLYVTCLLSGLAIAIKVSAIAFVAIPVLALIYKRRYWDVFKFLILTAAFGIFFAPHNLLSLNEFLGSMRYERDVAFGIDVFYTRQFLQTMPILFQLEKIFPYALGLLTFIFSIFGMLFIKKDEKTNLLRLAFFIYFFASAFFFAKWTRFMAPIFPLMIIFAALFLSTIKRRTILTILTILAIIPGIAYLSIYQSRDVRHKASDWIYQNVPSGSRLLFETANVIDVPIPDPSNKRDNLPSYQMTSFNHYNIDYEIPLYEELQQHIEEADYILIPSRRVFANHTCYVIQNSEKCEYLKKRYPRLNKYYDDLFSGKMGFKKVAEFSSYPKLEIGNWKLEFPDEGAEETWTVFDHPVIRIYKRV